MAKLYSLSLKSAPDNRKLRYGGEEHTLGSFHYRSTSTVNECNKKGSRRFEYIDVKEDAPIIYRWEIKGALATQMRKKNGKRQHRVFTPFTVYKAAHSADQYICLATMTVRCSTRRFDFLVMKVGSSSQTPEMWQGLDRMKHFYACPEIPVDHSLVKRDRFRYWDCEQHIYREDRLILLDTRFPSNKNLPNEKLEIVKARFNQWILYPGRLKAHEDSMLEEQSLLQSRSIRQSEGKAMKESVERTKELMVLIKEAQNSQPAKSAAAEKKPKLPAPPQKKRKKSNGGRKKSSKEIKSTTSNPKSMEEMQRQIDQLTAKLGAAERKNSAAAVKFISNSTSSSSNSVHNQEISPPSKRIADLEKASKEEDLKIALIEKKRKVAEEENDLLQLKAMKKRLKLETVAHANKLLHEGELQRVKLKTAADEVQHENQLRRRSIGDNDRMRQNAFQDSQNRQQLQFAAEEHAVAMEKERARIQNAGSTIRHNQVVELAELNQRPTDLVAVTGKSSKQQNLVDDSKQSANAHVQPFKSNKIPKKTKSSASTTPTTAGDKERLILELKKRLREENELQNRIREAEASAKAFSDEVSKDDDDDDDSSDAGDSTDDDDDAEEEEVADEDENDDVVSGEEE